MGKLDGVGQNKPRTVGFRCSSLILLRKRQKWGFVGGKCLNPLILK